MRQAIVAGTILMLAATACADAPVSFEPIAREGLTAFVDPLGQWQKVGEVRLHPDDPGRLTAAAGTDAIWNGSGGRSVNLLTRRKFGDCQIHLEFIISAHSNSGVYLMGRYELQIYDSYGRKTDAYPGIECGGIYPRWIDNQNREGHSPLVNASKPAGQWQTFDITFRAPRFDSAGKKIESGRFVKVVHNGQIVQKDVEVNGPTRSASFDDEQPTGPLMLQGDHGPVAFRNIRIQELDPTTHQAESK